MELKLTAPISMLFVLQFASFSLLHGQDKYPLSIHDLESRFATLNRTYIKSATVVYKRKENHRL